MKLLFLSFGLQGWSNRQLCESFFNWIVSQTVSRSGQCLVLCSVSGSVSLNILVVHGVADSVLVMGSVSESDLVVGSVSVSVLFVGSFSVNVLSVDSVLVMNTILH